MGSEKNIHDAGGELAAYFFHQGTNYNAYDYLGLHIDGDTFIFRVWAPNAEAVYVSGDFNQWTKSPPMKRISEHGIWEIYIDRAEIMKGDSCGGAYKYIIVNSGREIFKADPYAFFSQKPPETASLIYDIKAVSSYQWHDKGWLNYRSKTAAEGFHRNPLNIYEMQVQSWKKHDNGSVYSWSELAAELAPYIKQMGYTHIELMPIMEHPYDGSWGYQVTGFYSPTARLGTPEELCKFVDEMHMAGIGVILDWVPAHFPKDAHGLFEFDGSPLYEYQGADRMEHRGWGTRRFDVGREEVQSFLISNASYWLQYYHIDGLRVDAVASMLYLDYDKMPGEWIPNIYGDNRCLEAIAFFKKLNSHIKNKFPYAMMIAEESSAFANVTGFENDGLGFTFKWNMGWMNDVLFYAGKEAVFRKYHHEKMTFSMTYIFSEKYVLPISHDEVVHGKKSLIDKMPGDYWQKFAGARAFAAFMITHPGKKLNFMSNELGQFKEWDYKEQIEWFLLDYEMHAKLQFYHAVLNHFYLENPELWQDDESWSGFDWIDANNKEQSIFSFIRRDKSGNELVVIANFTPSTYRNFNLGVKTYGEYREVLNSDETRFGGSGVVNKTIFTSRKTQWNGCPYSIEISVPPLAVAIFDVCPKELPKTLSKISAKADTNKQKVGV